MSTESFTAPAALPPPPRNVHRRPGTSGLPGWTTMVLLPFAAVGLLLLIAIPLHLSFLPKPGVVVIFDLMIAAFLIFVRIPLMQEKKLVQTGIAVAGTVLESQSFRSKTTMYAVTFTFKNPDGTEMKKKAVVSGYGFGKITIGQAVTVLMPPARPESAMIYECCQYEVVP